MVVNHRHLLKLYCYTDDKSTRMLKLHCTQAASLLLSREP